jgi:uncharacterized phage protein (TIGR01671 family)
MGGRILTLKERETKRRREVKEFLFRGKTEEGKWVEGDLINLYKKTLIAGPDRRASEFDGVSVELNCSEVLPDTVGLWSGKTDKNGIKIFEGDKVRVTIEGQTFESVVSYNSRWSLKYVGKWRTKYYFIPTSKKIEVIGNLWDNRELLGVK